MHLVMFYITYITTKLWRKYIFQLSWCFNCKMFILVRWWSYSSNKISCSCMKMKYHKILVNIAKYSSVQMCCKSNKYIWIYSKQALLYRCTPTDGPASAWYVYPHLISDSAQFSYWRTDFNFRFCICDCQTTDLTCILYLKVWFDYL